MVIFGAGGDMTKRLMMPALYNLSRTGLLPARAGFAPSRSGRAKPQPRLAAPTTC